jgi:hypothetical protein
MNAMAIACGYRGLRTHLDFPPTYARAASGHAAAAAPRIVTNSRRVVRSAHRGLPGQLAQQPLGDPHDVVFPVIRACLLTRTSPIDALEGGLAWIEAECRRRGFVNDLVFANRKLTGHNWRGHLSSCQIPIRARHPAPCSPRRQKG